MLLVLKGFCQGCVYIHLYLLMIVHPSQAVPVVSFSYGWNILKSSSCGNFLSIRIQSFFLLTASSGDDADWGRVGLNPRRCQSTSASYLLCHATPHSPPHPPHYHRPPLGVHLLLLMINCTHMSLGRRATPGKLCGTPWLKLFMQSPASSFTPWFWVWWICCNFPNQTSWLHCRSDGMTTDTWISTNKLQGFFALICWGL